MAKVITVWWRDIPSQVIVKAGRRSAKILLPDRFQEAIDKAAMRAGAGTTDAYLADWHREETEATGELDALAAEKAQQYENEYSDARLQALVDAAKSAPRTPTP